MDTSAWIDYLEGEEAEIAERLGEVLERGSPFGFTSVIYQEVLQVVSSQREFERVEQFLGSQRFYFPEHPIESHKEAARIYFDCRRAGVTIRSAIDCLIARVAIENDLSLLHSDRDFEYIARVESELNFARGEGYIHE